MKTPSCPFCGGPGVLLGVLGLLRWLRCRYCGMDFNKRRRSSKKAGTPQAPRS